MKKKRAIVLVTYVVAFLLALNEKAQSNAPLKLVQTIPMPGVQGRMDHLNVDVKGKRLFVPANGDNQNSVEVIDLKADKWISSIPGQCKPQGTFYSHDFNTLYVTNGTDGTCKIFRGDTFKLIDSLLLGTDANQVGYDPDTNTFTSGSVIKIPVRWQLSIRRPISRLEKSNRTRAPKRVRPREGSRPSCTARNNARLELDFSFGYPHEL